MARRTKGRRDGRWDRSDEEWGGTFEPRRRRDRREQRNERGRRPPVVASVPPQPAPPMSLIATIAAVERTCGRCREYVADDVSGRGECLHPGSGVLRPWWDTPACPFFA